MVEDNNEDRLRQAQNRTLQRQMRGTARQFSLNRGNGMDL